LKSRNAIEPESTVVFALVGGDRARNVPDAAMDQTAASIGSPLPARQ
jgi:hypothetical protein